MTELSSYVTQWLSTSLGVSGPEGTRLASTTGIAAGQSVTVDRTTRIERRWRRDREQLVNDPVIRRLAGVTQVLPPPGKHTSRFDHSVEVADIAMLIADRLGLSADLAGAIGLAHDCGHMVCGHAGEAVYQQLRPTYSHAKWGAEQVLRGRGYSTEVRSGVRTHSWSEAPCTTPEAEIVRWADRIAYLTSDFADAVALGLVSDAQLPAEITDIIGATRDEQQQALASAVISASSRARRICTRETEAVALAQFRHFNSAAIYSHPEVVARNVEGEQLVLAAATELRARGNTWHQVTTQLTQMTDAEVSELVTCTTRAA